MPPNAAFGFVASVELPALGATQEQKGGDAVLIAPSCVLYSAA